MTDFINKLTLVYPNAPDCLEIDNKSDFWVSEDTTTNKSFIVRSSLEIEEQEAERFLTGFIDTLYDGLKNIQPVTIEHLGSFYIAEKRASRIFKFNPAQKLKAILGWSSSYKGDI